MPPSLPSFAEQTRDARKVLVVHLGFLGDAIHLLPALWTLRQHYAHAQLHLVSTPAGCAAVELTRAVNQCWRLELLPEKRSLRSQWQLLQSLRQERFDVAVDLTAVDRSIVLMGLIGAHRRLGLLGGREHFWNSWLIPEWLPRPSPTQPLFQQLLHALTTAGFPPGTPQFNLKIPTPDKDWAEHHLPTDTIHVSLCAGNPLKEWPLDHYANLIHQLLQLQPARTIAISASNRPREQARLDAFQRLVSSPRILRLPADLTLGRLAATLQRSTLHIGPDSGVIHLAMALGTPTVSFFRRRSEGWQAWVPPGPLNHSCLQDCTCTRDRGSPCAASGQPACLAALQPNTVLTACRSVLDAPRLP